MKKQSEHLTVPASCPSCGRALGTVIHSEAVPVESRPPFVEWLCVCGCGTVFFAKATMDGWESRSFG